MIERCCSLFGTLQAGFSNFHYLRPIWTQTTQKDALLGGMTGIGSGKILEFDLKIAANTAKVVNSLISEKLELMKLLELLVLNLQEQLL
jgi:ribonucleoside-diphosphate reductase alpha chain